MTEKIGIQAVLEDAQFQAGLQRYVSGLQMMDSSAVKVAGSSEAMGAAVDASGDALASTGDDALTTAAKIEILEKAFAQVKELAATGLELAELGAMSERVEQRFVAFAEAAGGAEKILAAFQEGAGGTVSEMDAMASASRLLQMGLVTNADEMSTVVEMATRLGDQAASATDRVSDFALMLANQSIPRLDNFGISSGKVRAKIQELQDANAGMSRETAFMTATLEEGRRSLDLLGPRVDDNAAAFERAQAKIANTRVEIGQKLAPIVARIVGAFADLEGSTIAIGAAFATALGIAVKFSGGLGNLATKIGMSSGQLLAGAAAVGVLLIAYDQLSKQLDRINEKQQQAVEAAAAWETQAGQMIGEGQSLNTVLDDLANRTNAATDAWNSNLVTGTALGGLFGSHNKMLGVLSETQMQVTEIVLRNTASYGEYRAAIELYNASISDSSARVTVLSEVMFRLLDLSQQSTTATAGLAEEQWKLALHTDNAVVAAESYDAALLNLNQAYSAGIIVTDAHQAALIREYQALQDEQGAAAAAAAQLEQVKAAQDAARAAAEGHTQALLKQAEQLSNTDAAGVAHAAIARLDKLLDEGVITFDDYDAAVRQVQDTFELVTPEGRALAEGIDALGAMLARKQISAEDYDEALQGIYEAAEDSAEAVHDFVLAIGAAPADLDRGAGALDGWTTAQDATRNATDAAKTSTKEMADEVNAVDLSAAESEVRLYKQKYDDLATSAGDSRTAVKEMAQEASTETVTGLGIGQGALEEFVTAEDNVMTAASDAQTAIGNMAGAASSSVADLEDGAGAADGMATSTGTARDSVDLMKRSLGEVPDAAQQAASGMSDAGSAFANNFKAGFDAAWGAVRAAVGAAAASIAALFPGSEPKDTTSPLYGLSDRGVATVMNYAAGIESAAGAMTEAGESIAGALIGGIDATLTDEQSRIEELFTVSGILGATGGEASRILQIRTGELQDLIKNLQEINRITTATYASSGERLEEIIAALGGRAAFGNLLTEYAMWQGGRRDITFTQTEWTLLREGTALMQERSQMAEDMLANDQARLVYAQELAESEERILALKQAQQQLRFLEQQRELLDLIAQYELDASEILGGLTLGIEANINDVIDAMTRALIEIIEQVDEELEIGSPSRVFARIGGQMMEGLAFGIEQMMSLPVSQSAIATQAMVSAPMGMMAQPMVQQSTQVDMRFGNVSISDEVGLARFGTTVRHAVERGIRGEVR